MSRSSPQGRRKEQRKKEKEAEEQALRDTKQQLRDAKRQMEVFEASLAREWERTAAANAMRAALPVQVKEERDLVSAPGSGGRSCGSGSGRKAKKSSAALFDAGCQGDAVDMVGLTNDNRTADEESVEAIAVYAAVFVISVLDMHARLSRNNHDVLNKGCKLGCDQVKGQPPPPSIPPGPLT
eukprot:360590-Rhodomonas_salina.1